MKKTIKYLVGILLAVLSFAFTPVVEAQQYSQISLPFTYIAGGNGVAANTFTNLSSGWSNAVIVTNVSTLWTNTGSFVTSTNYTTNYVQVFADFDATGRRYVVLQTDFATQTSGNTSNLIFTVARSVTKSRFSTTSNLSVTNTANGTTNTTTLYQIDMGGYPYGRIIDITWGSTNITHVATNLAIYAGVIKNQM